jgi:hypothetical protein
MRWQTTEQYYRNFLAQQLKIPVVGKVFFVAPVNTQYDSWLRREMDVPAELMFTGPANAFSAMTADRNDVVLVAPGTYAVTASLDWSKAHTHMVGLGGPNNGSDYGDGVGSIIYTTTAAVAQVLNLTGSGCNFHNVGFDNNGVDATSYAAVLLNGLGAWFKNCSILGNMNTTQSASANCCSLRIAGGNGMYPQLDDCIIGSDVWGARTGTHNAQILFNGTGQPNGGIFRRCRICSNGNTAAINMVSFPSVHGIGVGWTFEDCGFLHTTHLTGAQGTSISSAFYFNTGYDKDVEVILRRCYASNITEWTDQDQGNLLADMPITGTGGGLTREPTAVVGS